VSLGKGNSYLIVRIFHLSGELDTLITSRNDGRYVCGVQESHAERHHPNGNNHLSEGTSGLGMANSKSEQSASAWSGSFTSASNQVFLNSLLRGKCLDGDWRFWQVAS
jgi:hypothetical protein